MSRPTIHLSDAAYRVGLKDVIQRAERELAATAQVRIVVSQTIMDDLSIRCPDPDGCWKGIEHAGVHKVTQEQADRIAGDCDYQGNITGNWIDSVSGGLTRAYRALYAQIKG